MNGHHINSCLRKLDSLADSTYRRDFRDTANLARQVIRGLLLETSDETVRVELIAQKISERAAATPQMVYRTKKTGELRWVSASAPSASRVKPEQIVGVFDAGNDWRVIHANLADAA